MENKYKVDHSGEVYGRLTLLYRGEDYVAPKTGKKKQRYYCSCSCGKYTKENPKLIVYEAIKSGLVKSCGCLHDELVVARNKSKKIYNRYDLSGEYGIGYTTKDEEFYFDLDDYNKIKDYCWYIDSSDKYVRTHCGNKHIAMHRLIMNFPNGKFHIDHKNGYDSRNDNRKSNLRIATCSQNQMNRGLQKNNKTGVSGAVWRKDRNVWELYITVEKKRIYLGCFDNLEDAVIARREAEKKYFREFAYNYDMNGSDFNECIS